MHFRAITIYLFVFKLIVQNGISKVTYEYSTNDSESISLLATKMNQNHNISLELAESVIESIKTELGTDETEIIEKNTHETVSTVTSETKLFTEEEGEEGEEVEEEEEEKKENEGAKVDITTTTTEENAYWIVSGWEESCHMDPCMHNQTRTVNCSSDTKACDNSTKPADSRPCPIQNGLVCKNKVNSVLNKLLSYFHELFRNENLIE